MLGSSEKADAILHYMDVCSRSVRAIVESGRNIVHGCGNAGIMGSAYDAGKNFSKKNKNHKLYQNLAIIANPRWGDEDLEHCIPLTQTRSEAARIEKFREVANTFLVFPGSSTTLQEVTTLIAKNYYAKPEDKKRIILVGKDYYKGLCEQYQKLWESGLLKCEPEELFTVVDSEREILDLIEKE